MEESTGAGVMPPPAASVSEFVANDAELKEAEEYAAFMRAEAEKTRQEEVGGRAQRARGGTACGGLLPILYDDTEYRSALTGC